MDNEYDNDLIRQAELWATGATIHDVKTLIGMLRSASHVFHKPNGTPRKRAFAEDMMKAANARLVDFMRHGNYTKACDDNPLPSIPE